MARSKYQWRVQNTNAPIKIPMPHSKYQNFGNMNVGIMNVGILIVIPVHNYG